MRPLPFCLTRYVDAPVSSAGRVVVACQVGDFRVPSASHAASMQKCPPGCAVQKPAADDSLAVFARFDAAEMTPRRVPIV
jgi:hypothetical protein